MNIFFYGLFMDENVLAEQGITPSSQRSCTVEDFALRIGARASLVRSPGARVYGILMDLEEDEVARLYQDTSVADYEPIEVTASLEDGSAMKASCYVLPLEKVSGTNRDYAAKLADLGERLGFPAAYLNAIRRA